MAHTLPYYEETSKKPVYEQVKQFLESDSKYATAANILLATAVFGGIVFIGAVAPNLIQIFRSKKKKKFTDSQIRNAVRNLNKHGFIKMRNHKDGTTEVVLTNKGEERIKKFCFQNLIIKKPSRWDAKWRVVVFDIPIGHNSARAALREKIREIGFYKLQDSVWLYPYPCEDELLFIAHIFGIEDCLNILTVDRVLHEEKLIKIFKLGK